MVVRVWSGEQNPTPHSSGPEKREEIPLLDPPPLKHRKKPKHKVFFGGGLRVPKILMLKSRWPRFGSVTVWGWNGSSGSGFRFRRFL